MAATDIERRWYASGDEIAALLSSLNAFLSGELPEDRVQRINIVQRVALEAAPPQPDPHRLAPMGLSPVSVERP